MTTKFKSHPYSQFKPSGDTQENNEVIFEYRYYDIDESSRCYCKHERFKWCNIHWSCCCCQCRVCLCMIAFWIFLFFIISFLLIIAYFGGYIFQTIPQKPPCCTSSNCKYFDYASFDEILANIVKPNETTNGIQTALIDYQQLTQNKALNDKFSAFTHNISVFDVSSLSCSSQFAFYINAYNALTIKMILDHRASDGGFVDSITDIRQYFGLRPVWKINAGTIGRSEYNLYNIKHDILRKHWKNESKLHAALSCASLSCPDLRASAYRANDLESQLLSAFRAWTNNTSKGMRIEQSNLFLNEIFLWYSDDFKPSVKSFISEFTTNENVRNTKTIKYLPFDWDLNIFK